MILTEKQTTALDYLEDMNNNVTEVIYGGSAGSGKSILGCYWLLKSALSYPETRWLMGRSVLKTLKKTTLQSFFWVCAQQGLEPKKHYIYKEQSGEILLYNGSVIILADCDYYPSDPLYDRFGGFELTGAFIDEIAQIRHKAWTVIMSRLRYKLIEYNIKPKIMGSLNPSKNWVYTLIYKPFKADELKPSIKFIQALPTDNPSLPQTYLDLLNALPKSDRDRLYLGLWEATDDNQMINQENIGNLFTNDFIMPDRNDYYITADIARSGNDKSVIILWAGKVIIDIKTLIKSKLDETAKVIRTIARNHSIPMSRVLVDESGIGSGVVDILKCKGFVGGSKALNNENYLNLRTQCFYYLAKELNDNQMYFMCDIEADTKTLIIEELEQVTSNNKEGADEALRIIPKDLIISNIGRSPDYSDALSMRCWFDVNKQKGIYYF